MNLVLAVICAERYSRPFMELWNIGEIFIFINNKHFEEFSEAAQVKCL